MRKKNRLGMLHVGHASHGDFQVSFCLGDERLNEGDQSGANLCRCIDHEKAKIRGDQLVAAAAGVELPAEGAEFLDEGLFNKMMNVFGIPRRICLSKRGRSWRVPQFCRVRASVWRTSVSVKIPTPCKALAQARSTAIS